MSAVGTGSGARGGSSGERTSAARRVRYGAASVAIVVCAGLSLLLANLVAQDPRLRVVADVTATGEHRLAPRTMRVLEALSSPGEIVIAGAAGTDRDVRRRVGDVLDAMARTGRVKVSWIDDPGGPEFMALLQRLVERDAAEVASAASALRQSAEAIDMAAGVFEELEAALRDMAVAIPATDTSAGATTARQWATQQSDTARVLAVDARSASQAVRGVMEEPTSLGVPPLDRAEAVVRRSLSKIASDLGALGASLERAAAGEATPRESVMRARAMVPSVERARQAAALASDQAASRRMPDLVRVLRALESSECVLVVLEGAVTAVSFAELFPPAVPQTVGGARADLGVQAEDLLASAIGTLVAPSSPIVVIAHAEDARFLDQRAITALLGRLSLRRIDVLEWRVVHEADPPSLTALDPEGVRPVVYVALATNAAAGASGGAGLIGADRAARLGAVLRRLSDRAASILVSINPSYLAASGGSDEATAFLAEAGLRVDSGRTLLTERIESGRRIVDTDRRVATLSPGEGVAAHPILTACAGLPMLLRWVVGLEAIEAPTGVRAVVTPLVEVAGVDTWAERQWYNYWQVPADQRGSIAQPPTPDPGFGDVTTGPWVVAAAVERTGRSLPRAQRLVVVGSNGWFFDAVAAQTEVVNGRVVPTFPGNAELFEASVYWLAGQEEFIGRSAASGSVATIRAMEPGEMSLVRWVVLGVLPVGVLVLGVVWRLARG